MSSRFSSNSEASASELLEKLEEDDYNLQSQTDVLSAAKELT